MARIITITSGKGGVGKTSVSLNLSLSLASQGFKVCLFDADLGLANVSILTGIYPKKDLASVIDGDSGIREILIKDYQGIDIIPGSNGVDKLADLTRTQTAALISTFLDLDDYDFFIFDTSAGISSQVISFCMSSHEIVLIATTEPTSLTDAYAMLKVLSKYSFDGPVKIVINQVTAGHAARKAYNQLKKTADKYLSIHIEPLGIMAKDKSVRTAVLSQNPFSLMFPDSVASKCIQSMADKLANDSGFSTDMPIEMFWGRCISFMEKYQEKNRNTCSKKTSGEQESSRSQEKALANIENYLKDLKTELESIKQILGSHELVPKAAMPRTPVEMETRSNVVSFESRMERNQSGYLSNTDSFKPDKRAESIARGKLRNPTEEELANWNEYDNPIIIKSAET
jgi:flagellar biosynthesis protein FlhG